MNHNSVLRSVRAARRRIHRVKREIAARRQGGSSSAMEEQAPLVIFREIFRALSAVISVIVSNPGIQKAFTKLLEEDARQAHEEAPTKEETSEPGKHLRIVRTLPEDEAQGTTSATEKRSTSSGRLMHATTTEAWACWTISQNIRSISGPEPWILDTAASNQRPHSPDSGPSNT